MESLGSPSFSAGGTFKQQVPVCMWGPSSQPFPKTTLKLQPTFSLTLSLHFGLALVAYWGSSVTSLRHPTNHSRALAVGVTSSLSTATLTIRCVGGVHLLLPGEKNKDKETINVLTMGGKEYPYFQHLKEPYFQPPKLE